MFGDGPVDKGPSVTSIFAPFVPLPWTSDSRGTGPFCGEDDHCWKCIRQVGVCFGLKELSWRMWEVNSMSRVIGQLESDLEGVS